MNREQLLAAGAVAVVAVALLVAAVVPAAVSPPDEGPTRPGYLDVADVTIQPSTVSGQTVTLHVETFLRHRGPASSNVTLRFRATDSESGMLETAQVVDVGDVSEEGERVVPVDLSVEREGGYRIEVLVYQDGRRVETGGRTVAGLEALTPEYARTPIGFVDEGRLSPVDVSVREAGANRTTLEVSSWLTNRGDDAAGGLRTTVILRQADSHLVAARESTDVGQIGPGRTATADTTLTVPAGYNYYVDVVLWNDGVIVDTARAVVNLDPTETISANQTTREVELRVSDFERREGGTDTGATPQETSAQTPGFGPIVAVIALLAVALLARRWDE